ncbi:GSCFA domain-containing protein [Fertoebacter nigrum]|uniref:GSCFA domain-containing protein n=1 Tax=Fertoeibacter niger TaxID=2656921 RepID=A0A8X8KQR0_9RHOB|nr:GSCFA domain-containing protein [Fertoeibacter niger]NUB46515.1 GSCFA domain-containing protein [Fertoeibacter niger]
MTLGVVSPDQALQTFKIDGATQWGKGRNSHQPGTNPMNASARLHQQSIRFFVDGTPEQILPGSTIFAVGSCFAREIERHLARQGFKIASFVPGETDDGKSEVSITNRYNTASMLLEMRRLLEEPDILADDALLIEQRPGSYADAHYHDATVGDKETVLGRRKRFYEHFQSIRDADVLFFTLGLNEAGYDTRNGLYRNMSPTVRELRLALPLEVHSFTVAENVAALHEIYRLVRTHCTKNPKVFITVSPVPLTLTYQRKDVILANMEGKSILRAAAAEFCAQVSDVIYFPSFEMAMSCDPHHVFRGDKRHINSDFVSSIVGEFVRRHCMALADSQPVAEAAETA